jgi:hypothetical protein
VKGARRLLPAVLAALALGACGSDDEGEPIPQASVAEIDRQLDNIRGQIENGSVGACDDIDDDTFPALQAAASDVPPEVDADVRDALQSSVDRLRELIDQECGEISQETETTPEEIDTVTVEEPPEEETVPTETVPPRTTPEEEEDGGTEIPQDGEENQGEGQGQGPLDGTGSPGGGVSPPEGGNE